MTRPLRSFPVGIITSKSLLATSNQQAKKADVIFIALVFLSVFVHGLFLVLKKIHKVAACRLHSLSLCMQ